MLPTRTIGSNTRPWMTWPFGDLMMHVDWGGNLQTRKSTIGYVFLLNNRAVSWSSHKEPTFILSTTKAEYMAYHKHLKKLFGFIAFLVNSIQTKGNTHMFSNNQGCLSLLKNLIHHSRTKHIDIQHHYDKEMVSVRSIRFEYVPIAKMVVDILTKSCPYKKNTFWCMEMLGV